MKKDRSKELAQEFRLKLLRQRERQLRRGNDYVPTKKSAKPVGYKMQNTFEENLRGVPGGSRVQAVSLLKQMQAATTGTKVVEKAPGLMRSMRNANTTQGSYIRTELRDQTGDLISNPQGRRL